ncbi:unnamed protein product [Gordionus sp. m RMFG-2023]
MSLMIKLGILNPHRFTFQRIGYLDEEISDNNDFYQRNIISCRNFIKFFPDTLVSPIPGDNEKFMIIMPLGDFNIEPEALKNFAIDFDYAIREESIGNSWCFILPSMKQGRAIGIRHRPPINSGNNMFIPGKSVHGKYPLRNYQDFKPYWRDMWGYELPNDEGSVFYVEIYFRALWPNFFTYPSICVRTRPNKVIRKFRNSREGQVLNNFANLGDENRQNFANYVAANHAIIKSHMTDVEEAFKGLALEKFHAEIIIKMPPSTGEVLNMAEHFEVNRKKNHCRNEKFIDFGRLSSFTTPTTPPLTPCQRRAQSYDDRHSTRLTAFQDIEENVNGFASSSSSIGNTIPDYDRMESVRALLSDSRESDHYTQISQILSRYNLNGELRSEEEIGARRLGFSDSGTTTITDMNQNTRRNLRLDAAAIIGADKRVANQLRNERTRNDSTPGNSNATKIVPSFNTAAKSCSSVNLNRRNIDDISSEISKEVIKKLKPSFLQITKRMDAVFGGDKMIDSKTSPEVPNKRKSISNHFYDKNGDRGGIESGVSDSGIDACHDMKTSRNQPSFTKSSNSHHNRHHHAIDNGKDAQLGKQEIMKRLKAISQDHMTTKKVIVSFPLPRPNPNILLTSADVKRDPTNVVTNGNYNNSKLLPTFKSSNNKNKPPVNGKIGDKKLKSGSNKIPKSRKKEDSNKIQLTGNISLSLECNGASIAKIIKALTPKTDALNGVKDKISRKDGGTTSDGESLVDTNENHLPSCSYDRRDEVFKSHGVSNNVVTKNEGYVYEVASQSGKNSYDAYDKMAEEIFKVNLLSRAKKDRGKDSKNLNLSLDKLVELKDYRLISQFSTKDLKDWLKRHDVKGYSKLKKDELIKLLQNS